MARWDYSYVYGRAGKQSSSQRMPEARNGSHLPHPIFFVSLPTRWVS